MTSTPSRRTTPRTRPATRAAGLTPRGRVLRRAAGGALAGLAVASAASLTSTVIPDASSPTVSVSAQTQAQPSPVAAALVVERPVRASRSRTPAPKRVTPTKQVVKTVEVGPSFSGQASWYGGSFQGQRTANGERFDTNDLTAASKTLPFGTRLRVCHDGCVVVRINDRGPYVGGRVLDLSRAASDAIGFSGVAHVTATPIDERTVTVVDSAALRKLQAHEAHVRLVARSHRLRAAQLARAADAAQQAQLAKLPVAASTEPSNGRVPAPASASLLTASAGGLLLLRRVRP
jgi:rare lipoprotein A